MSITISASPSRTSGVAPLYVFLDMTGTTASTTSKPFRELLYRVNWGDAGAGNWHDVGQSNRSKNLHEGAGVAGHVYETPGTYTPTVTVFDGTSVASYTVSTITVDDPDVVFSGTNTICVSTAGNFAGAPAGARQVTQGDGNALTPFNAWYTTGRRLLYREGETWTPSGILSIRSAGPGIIGKFPVNGTGAKPAFQSTGTIFEPNFKTTPSIVLDLRIMDLDLSGLSNAGSLMLKSQGTDKQLLLLRLDAHDCHIAFEIEYSVLDFYNTHGNPGHTPHDENAIVECTTLNIVTGSGGYSVYYASQRLTVLGNTFDNNTGGEHCQRNPHVGKGDIGHNLFRRSAVDKHVLTVRAPGFSGDTVTAAGTYTEQVNVHDNKFESGNTAWMTTTGPQNDQSDERVRNCVWEKNWWTGNTSATDLALRIDAVGLDVRNNLFDLSNIGTGGVCTQATTRSTAGLPESSDVVWQNNTAYKSDAGGMVMIALGTASSDTDVKANMVMRNNLAYAPAASGNELYHDYTTGSSPTVDHNSSNSQIDSTSPSFAGSNGDGTGTFTVPTDFKILTGSYAKAAGATVPVIDDFFERSRWNVTYDMGFHQFVLGSPLVDSGGAVAPSIIPRSVFIMP